MFAVRSACEVHAHTARTLARARARQGQGSKRCNVTLAFRESQRGKYLLGGTNAGAAMMVEDVQVVGGLPVCLVMLVCVRWRDRVSRMCQRASSMLEGRRGARRCPTDPVVLSSNTQSCVGVVGGGLWTLARGVRQTHTWQSQRGVD